MGRSTDSSQPTSDRDDRRMVIWTPSDCGEWDTRSARYAGDAILHIDGWPPLDLDEPAAEF